MGQLTCEIIGGIYLSRNSSQMSMTSRLIPLVGVVIMMLCGCSQQRAQSQLFEAVERKNAVGVRNLLAGGVNPNVRGDDGLTPLMLAVRRDQPTIVRMLLAAGARANETNDLGQTALFLAASYNHEEVAKLLIRGGADLNLQNKSGDTPLHEAASYYGWFRISRMLLTSGARVDVRNGAGRTPLHRAVASGQEELVGLLLERGAIVSARDIQGREPIHFSCTSSAITVMLIRSGANVAAADDDGNTPLHFAVGRGATPSVIRILLRNGADAHLGNKWGVTAVDEAARHHREDLLKLLRPGTDFGGRGQIWGQRGIGI